MLTDFLLPEVKTALNELAAHGIDPDLTLAYLEQTCPEQSLYDEPITTDELRLEAKRIPSDNP